MIHWRGGPQTPSPALDRLPEVRPIRGQGVCLKDTAAKKGFPKCHGETNMEGFLLSCKSCEDTTGAPEGQNKNSHTLNHEHYYCPGKTIFTNFKSKFLQHPGSENKRRNMCRKWMFGHINVEINPSMQTFVFSRSDVFSAQHHRAVSEEGNENI